MGKTYHYCCHAVGYVLIGFLPVFLVLLGLSSAWNPQFRALDILFFGHALSYNDRPHPIHHLSRARKLGGYPLPESGIPLALPRGILAPDDVQSACHYIKVLCDGDPDFLLECRRQRAEPAAELAHEVGKERFLA